MEINNKWLKRLLTKREEPLLREWLWMFIWGLVGAFIGLGAARIFAGQESFPMLTLLMVAIGGATGGAMLQAFRQKNRALAWICASLGGALLLAVGFLILLWRMVF